MNDPLIDNFKKTTKNTGRGVAKGLISFPIVKLGLTSGVLLGLGSLFFMTGALGDTRVNVTLTSNPSLEDGLVAHYTFDGEDLVSNVGDISSQGANGFLTGFTSTTTVQGTIGQGLDFDGSDDRIDLSNVSFSKSEGTVAHWMRPDQIRNMIALYFGSNSENGFSSGGNVFEFQTSITATGVFRMLYQDGLSSQVSTLDGGTPVAGEWAHIAFTWDTSGDAFFYLNGVEVATDDLTAYTFAGNATNFKLLGRPSDGTTDRHWDGGIDDVRIYDRALSADEVSRLYDLGATSFVNTTVTSNPNLESGLVGHWTFDGEDLINNATDRSGQGNDGFLTSFTSTTTVSGPIGQALDFDGVDDIVTATSPSLTGFPFSMAIWINLDDTADERLFQVGDDSSIDQQFLLTYLDARGWEYHARSGGSFDSTNFAVAGGAQGDTDGWKHVVGVSESATVHKLYIDGVLIDTDTNSVTFPTVDRIGIGGEIDTGPAYGDAVLDDARIYNRALSAEEVSRLYDLGATTYVNTTVTSNPDTENGLVAHWTFDGEDLINNVVDRSGQGNTGTLENFTSTTTARGKIGQALEFDGSDDEINVGDLDIGSTYTVAAWLKYNAVTTYDFHLGKDAASDSYAFGTGPSSTFYHAINDGSWAEYNSSEAPSVGVWYHVVWTRDGNSNLVFYLNGAENQTFSSVKSPQDVSTDTYIGGRADGSVVNHSGIIDDLRVYNRALSADEVSRLYDVGN